MGRQNEGEFCRGVSPHRHEARVPQAELSRVAVDQIQADGKNDVDADINGDAEIVTVEMRREPGNRERRRDREEQPSFCAGQHQTFSTWALTSRPAGLNSRIRIKMAKAMPSR